MEDEEAILRKACGRFVVEAFVVMWTEGCRQGSWVLVSLWPWEALVMRLLRRCWNGRDKRPLMGTKLPRLSGGELISSISRPNLYSG